MSIDNIKKQFLKKKILIYDLRDWELLEVIDVIEEFYYDDYTEKTMSDITLVLEGLRFTEPSYNNECVISETLNFYQKTYYSGKYESIMFDKFQIITDDKFNKIKRTLIRDCENKRNQFSMNLPYDLWRSY